MFKELYTMIDELHTIINSPQFKYTRYRYAMDKISDAFDNMSEKIVMALPLVNLNKNFLPSQEMLDAGGGPTSKRFAELYTKTKNR